MMPDLRVGRAILLLRWLSRELAAEGSKLAHVPVQIADALVLQAGGCSLCGGPLPAPVGRGRPRSRCLDCSPRRKSTVNIKVVA
jgi:hypothetical protein